MVCHQCVTVGGGSLLVLLQLLLLSEHYVQAFTPLLVAPVSKRTGQATTTTTTAAPLFLSIKKDDEEEEVENPYADPNYPDLEFVNYSDPEYMIDQSDEYFDNVDANDEELVEAMREERRTKNDMYQFQTYYEKVLRNGEEYRGEWTVYQSSTFLDHIDDSESPIPKLVKLGDEPLTVVSRGYKELNNDGTEHIIHTEEYQTATAMMDTDIANFGIDDENDNDTNKHVIVKYSPDRMTTFDFRGHQGNMVCGKAWTICTAVPLLELAEKEKENHVGPFSEYRTEVGIQVKDMRFRVKLDYGIHEKEKSNNEVHPPLSLKSLTVCREALNMWPRSPTADSVLTDALFGPKGAAGGLFDPPPVGTDQQRSQYMMVDLEGGATLLFPYKIDQDPQLHEGEGWVTTLDWNSGGMRYQVDRKINGGYNILGLRTLELVEILCEDVEQYRPRDGGMDMRQ